MSDTPLPLPNAGNVSPGSGQASADQALAQPNTTSAPAKPVASTTEPTTAGPTTIVYDDFAKVELRVGTVLEAKPAPKGDKLLVLQVDLGTEKRQILAGIRQHVAPEQMVGRQIVVVANLAPRKMMGLESQGMLLAATDASGKVVVVSPSEQVSPGSRVS